MRKGEIWHVDLNPVKGSEQAGFRPMVILSGNLVNRYLKVVITAPLTSSIKNYKGIPILDPSPQNGLKFKSELMVFHIRSISKDRLIEKIGKVSKVDLDEALDTLKDITT